MTVSTEGALAVIGMAGRFPGAEGLDTFWRNLCAGVESVTSSAPEELAGTAIPESVYRHAAYVPAKGRIAGIDLFDADFFGLGAHEAELTDPQHRLFLECAWEAVEHAGYDTARFQGRVGVYAGQSMNTYMLHNSMLNASTVSGFYLDYMPTMISANDDFLATRVSYKLDLRGPAMTVQTACSTSLVAIHQACQSLLSGETDMALAGGVSLTVPDAFGHVYREGAGLSRDGHCRAFDSATSGIVGGDGLGVVVLRRLEDALNDSDFIHAVIIGSAVNNDGASKAGFTAPSVSGQAQVVADALAMAGVSADSIGFVEAHGTATPLGDPIEVAGLTKAFRLDSERLGYCALGSVKTNIGHLAAAAGVAGFIKTVLAVREGSVPGTLHFREPNPKLALESSPFFVNAETVPWPVSGPRRAGVTALGVGGTNAHVIVEQPPTRPVQASKRPWQLVIVSARTPGALKQAAGRLADSLEAGDVPLADATYTLQVGRKAFAYRAAFVCGDGAQAVAALRGGLGPAEPAIGRSVAFLFPGGGSQYAGMGRYLYESEPVFREHLDRCADLADPLLGYGLREAMWSGEHLDTSRGMLTSLFAVDYALARLWMSWGLKPAAMLGHSLGEYVAACLAGVFSLPDAVETVVVRAGLMDEVPGGALLSVSLPEAKLVPLLGDDVSLSAVNAPGQCTVGGEAAAVERLAERLSADGIDFRRLHVHQPAHTHVLEPVLERFATHLRRITLKPPQHPFLSGVTGDWITEAEATSVDYWVRHLRGTVRFGDAARTLLKLPNLALVEAGPGTALSTLAQANMSEGEPRPPVVASLHHPRDPQPDQPFILGSLGRLWTSGVEIDWEGFWGGERRSRVPLPAYPFQRQSFWVGKGETPAKAEVVSIEADFGQSLHTRPHLMTDFEAPTDEVETTIVAVWQELLGFDRIGLHDNFYALGGSSLLAVRVCARLRERFPVELPQEPILVATTVAEQARVVRERLLGKGV